MPIKNALVVYKHSAYEIYFLKKKSSFYQGNCSLSAAHVASFKRAHTEHYKTLRHVEEILRKKNIRYRRHGRSSKIDYSGVDFVISVGGDGTFLETARGVSDQVILGVNSDPQRSVGRFCFACRVNFEKVIDNYLRGQAPIKNLQRLRLKLVRQKLTVDATNDILVCHGTPAAMSYYRLNIDGIEESHFSSGIWIATAAGSSGALKAAGGKVLPIDNQKIQFAARELYEKNGIDYRLRKGIVRLKKPIRIYSLMRSGMVYVDGPHVRFKFHFGETAEIVPSRGVLKVIHR